ncbi:MAG: hypothetical protein A2V63_10170 [Candidatus Eisenbacteria bacterium RBG_19FT_COMBO_70_11]|nr:MAG: hypothetical protein A2V63_10170 [Candidatus Eisenbacteria bacterium RBG_19FT_COMBO_70_11]
MQTASPIRSAVLDVGETTLVHIGVSQQGKTYRLGVFPKRSGDTVIFHTTPPQTRSLEKPREVVWVAHGLTSGQTLRIEAKQADLGVLPQDVYEITFPNNTVRSGGALSSPSRGLDLPWPYSILLLDASSGELAREDPVIIIKNDP